jgi:hypothetical protein
MDRKRRKLLTLGYLNKNTFAAVRAKGRVGKDFLEIGCAVGPVKILNLATNDFLLAALASQLKERFGISPT